MFGKKSKGHDREKTEAGRVQQGATSKDKRPKRKSDQWSDSEKVSVMISGIF
ncbi:hypothetical protein Sgleb_44020 [Streptomyces glebosus]|uniref:Uncharacterized protein n=1 Tax=Streptomyces glebosus TaxID=249580 RepID=A0A640T405_9ACTN|nr:hypothetical protein [Streptomyces glebosus]GFE16355.1 hypothetical protein Sgleb_44020 [Streptomyces glebosus]GHG64381.1 hypothetical protein GCM10010513_32370 [Streptomyces glebosus]